MLSPWSLAGFTTPGLFSKHITSRILLFSRAASSFPKPPSLSSAPPPEEILAARKWLDKFMETSIGRHDVELTFARSSGPGGQNVNKVNTKATIRCSLHKNWIPLWAHDKLMKSPAYVSSTHSLQITSTQHRSQSQNVEDCLAKLRLLIQNTCLAALPTPADPARLSRKEAYQRAAKVKSRSEKMHRSAIKRSRRGGDSWR